MIVLSRSLICVLLLIFKSCPATAASSERRASSVGTHTNPILAILAPAASRAVDLAPGGQRDRTPQSRRTRLPGRTSPSARGPSAGTRPRSASSREADRPANPPPTISTRFLEAVVRSTERVLAFTIQFPKFPVPAVEPADAETEEDKSALRQCQALLAGSNEHDEERLI